MSTPGGYMGNILRVDLMRNENFRCGAAPADNKISFRHAVFPMGGPPMNQAVGPAFEQLKTFHYQAQGRDDRPSGPMTEDIKRGGLADLILNLLRQ